MTMRPDQELLASLGIDSLAHVAHDAPQPEQAAGFAGGVLGWVGIPLILAGAQPYEQLPMERQLGERSTLRIERELVQRTVSGPISEQGEHLLLDSASERVVLEVTDLDGTPLVMDVQQGRVNLWSYPDAIGELEPPADDAPALEPPDLDAWAQGCEAEPWLRDLVSEQASSGVAMDQVVAAGSLARLWTSPEGRRVDPDKIPRVRLGAWLATVPAATIERLERVAVERAWLLGDRITELMELDGERAVEAVESIVQDRDELQSARRVFRLAGRGDLLHAALQSLDQEAVASLSVMANLLPAVEGGPEEDRWFAVAWQEPDAWWHGLA
jgi:hypothetical protein